MQSTLIIITGKTGAGKTTYADALHADKIGHVFSIDRWMKELFWQDMPSKPDMKWFEENQDWYTEKISRCESMIRKEATALLSLGVTPIFDLGFTSSAHRMEYVQLALDNAATPEIHFLDYNQETRWSRVNDRNKKKTNSYSMNVDRSMFDYIEQIFEPMSQKELKYVKAIKNHEKDYFS